MLAETLEQRLKWLHKEKYQYSNQEVFVIETKEGGEAKIHCLVNKDTLCFNGDQIHLTFLKQQKSVDGIVFIFSDKNEVFLHLVECKRTIRQNNWIETKEKFEGSLLTTLALQGLLNLPKIQNIYCYTAFREDKLTDRLKCNLVDIEAGMNPKQEQKENYHSGIDWLNDEINILSLHKIKHKKIELDKNTGLGEIDLTI
jgi:hypothetical protein